MVVQFLVQQGYKWLAVRHKNNCYYCRICMGWCCRNTRFYVLIGAADLGVFSLVVLSLATCLRNQIPP